MKNKIFSFILLSVIVIGYCGCSKSSPAPFTSYIKGKLDGVAFECATNIRVNKPSVIGGDNYIEISGNWPTGSIVLQIFNDPAITAVEYIFEAAKMRRGTISVDGRAYYAGDGGLGVAPTLHGSGKITIQEINSEFVKGIFDFISRPDDITQVIKTVTSGEFHIKRG